jgi:hypothetical protein
LKQETILHAEMNAVLIANRLSEGGTLYVVGKPVCARRATVIIQSGIQRVVGQYHPFKEANILFNRVEDVLPFVSGCIAANETVHSNYWLMTEITPCSACLVQVKKGRHDSPHGNMVLVDSRTFDSMLGGWEEYTYQCTSCGSIIEQTNDKNEVPPWWWFRRGEQ